MMKLFSRFLDLNQKEIDRLSKLVARVNSYTDAYSSLQTPEEFSSQTAEFKSRLAGGATLNDILPQAYALVREASFKSIGLRHYDVQIMAAIAFHEGKVAEQKTGEGKTLSAVPALYLNALSGRGVHLVTVNDYLARRDAGWNGPVFHLLGLTVGVIVHDQSYLYDPQYFDPTHGDDRLAHLRPVSRKEAYAADITYGTNNEYGFDYLRDNMVARLEDKVQRGHHFAIIDEVDSILIDEARTPLIISAPDTEPTDKYYHFAKIIERLTEGDYVVDEKHRTASLTETGLNKIEKILGVPNLYEKDFDTIHHLENALKARTLFHRDKEYIVRDGEVIIVDEFTGRLMPGRRWSEGMHQAVEAKEGVKIQQESKTLATISFQNYFRQYQKLAGMTGTAATEAEELNKIYKLEVVVVPTNKKVNRIDYPDVIYKNNKAKYSALADHISKLYQSGQPVLVGTTSIEKNEIIADLLKHRKIPHQVLNAKNHEREAQIIAEAGRKNAVTIATNIAGRGVDIILGGTPPPNPRFVLGEQKLSDKDYQKALAKWQKDHDEVKALGGLFVIGTERHESRRIDNQLRGRSGRQGDPGATLFYLSLEDDIMRIFGGDQVTKIMNFLKVPDNEPIQHPMVSKAIEQAQIKVEGFNFDARKHVVEYDDVMNKQREIIYSLRQKVLANDITHEEILAKSLQPVKNAIAICAPKGIIESEADQIVATILDIVPFDDSSQSALREQISNLHQAKEIEALAAGAITDAIEQRKQQVGENVWREIVKYAYLSSIDNLWVEHLDAIDDLRSGIGLRGYGQRDPLVEYKSEAFSMFERLVAQIDAEFSKRLLRVQVSVPTVPASNPSAPKTPPRPDTSPLIADQASQPAKGPATAGDFMSAFVNLSRSAPTPTAQRKPGRNDPCWCGSGKKYKKCHYPN